MTTQGRPPMIDGNMVFFHHEINLVKEEYNVGHHHLFLKPDYVVTLAYTFPSEYVCMVAASVKQPTDKYVRKVGNHIAYCRLLEAVETLDKEGVDLPKHCVVVDAEEVIEDRLNHDYGFRNMAAKLFTTKDIEARTEKVHDFFRSFPVKSFRHDNVQSAALAALINTDRAVRKAFHC